MLKLSWPHQEAAAEHLGLRHWKGNGIVRLTAAHPADFALLLEPLDSTRDLHSIETDDACRTIGGLLRRLNVAPAHSVPDFREEASGWIEPLRAYPPSVPRRWVDRALDTFDSRPYEPKLLHLDLHYGNVLAAEREPWLAIDPKPVAGPSGFEVYPALRTRVDDYRGGALMHAEVRSRVELISDEAGIDLDDAREWCIARRAQRAPGCRGGMADARDAAPRDRKGPVGYLSIRRPNRAARPWGLSPAGSPQRRPPGRRAEPRRR